VICGEISRETNEKRTISQVIKTKCPMQSSREFYCAEQGMNYQDLSGVEKIEEAEGLLSVCLQHEVDQLDGIFWIYRLSRLKRDRVVKRFDKTQRTEVPGD
jgi:Polypeptide deformylase